MTIINRAFYSSENGDQWLLVGTEGSTVRHQPNASSGGQSRDMDVKDFQCREHNSPQGVALRAFLNGEANAAWTAKHLPE